MAEHITWFIENPESSHFWDLAAVKRLLGKDGVRDISFTACNFGARRPKKTKLRTNAKGLEWMEGPCSQTHPPRYFDKLHAPWGRARGGRFATSEEAEYPEELCRVIVKHAFGQRATSTDPAAESSRDTHPSRKRQSQPESRDQRQIKQLRAAGVGRQPRGVNRLRVIPEHKELVKVQVASSAELAIAQAWARERGRRLSHPKALGEREFPKDSQLVAAAGRELGGRSGASAAQIEQLLRSSPVEVTVGIPFTQLEYFEALKQVDHPFGGGYPFRPRTAECLADLLRKSPGEVRQHRRDTLAKWAAMAKDLEGREAELHSRLHPDVQTVVAGKRLLLLISILESIGYEDVDAARSMITGFPIVGQLPDSLAFPEQSTPPRDTVRELIENAPSAQAAVESTRAGDEKMDAELYEVTEQEADGTRLLRRTTAEGLTAKFGPRWVPARRFGLRQGAKLRPIDDFSEQGHNATVGTAFKVDLGGVDEVVAIARTLGRSLREGAFEIPDERGDRRAGKTHERWAGPDLELRGCCLDLVAAFRQVP